MLPHHAHNESLTTASTLNPLRPAFASVFDTLRTLKADSMNLPLMANMQQNNALTGTPDSNQI